MHYNDSEIERLDSEVAAGRGGWFVSYAATAMSPGVQPPSIRSGPHGTYTAAEEAARQSPLGTNISFQATTVTTKEYKPTAAYALFHSGRAPQDAWSFEGLEEENAKSHKPETRAILELIEYKDDGQQGFARQLEIYESDMKDPKTRQWVTRRVLEHLCRLEQGEAADLSDQELLMRADRHAAVHLDEGEPWTDSRYYGRREPEVVADLRRLLGEPEELNHGQTPRVPTWWELELHRLRGLPEPTWSP